MQRNLFLFLLISLIPTNVCRAQEPHAAQLQGTQTVSLEQIATATLQTSPENNQTAEEQHHRLFGIFPTYTVSNNKSPSPLTARAKFRLFVKGSFDPFTLASVGFNAGLGQAENDLAGYGQGAAGYGKRVGAGLADETSGGFFGVFLLPSLFHEDPRYFRKGTGSFKARLGHALVRPVVIRKDSGGNEFNWSGILARFVTSGISNAYYPESDRGAGHVFTRAAVAIPFSVTGTIFNEFGPDLEKKFFGKRQNSQP